MRGRTIRRAALGMGLAAGALACAATIDAESVRDELVHQTGRAPVRELEWNLGLTARLAMRALGTRPDELLPIQGLTGLEVALYEADPAGSGDAAPLDLGAIDRRGWETVVRFRDAGASALVAVRPGGGEIEELVLVGSDRSQVVFARLVGSLDPRLPEALGTSVMTRGPEATKDALVELGARPEASGARRP